jgi:hypothetical protein
VASITCPVLAATADDVGLSLAEAKSLMTKLHEAMVRGQVADCLHCRRVCPDCLTFQPVQDRRHRRLQTLFGTVHVEASRLRIGRRRLPREVGEVTFSPVSELLPGVAHPNLSACKRNSERVRRSAKPPGSWRYCCPHHRPAMSASAIGSIPSLCSLRQPTPSERAGEACQTRDRRRPGRCPCPFRAGYQVRHFEAITGKAEVNGRPCRRFTFVGSATEQPAVLVRIARADQGWKENQPVTVISDGDPALPALVGTAAGRPVTHILDWFHISMRVRHIEQAMQGLKALSVQLRAPLDYIEIDVERLRHLLWNRYHSETHRLLASIASMSSNLVLLNGRTVKPKAWRFAELSEDLRTYIFNNHDAMIVHGRRWQEGKPISTSRAESPVNNLVNARMNKRRQMRWSPRGAHRVLQVRAVVLDGRFGTTITPLAA